MTSNYIQDLKALVHELHTPDMVAAFVVGSRANGYSRSDSDIDLGIVTKRTRGITYIKTNDLPMPVNIGYVTQDALNYFSIRRRSGMPFRVLPIDNDPYVAELAFGTKEELTKRVASAYHKQVGGAIPLLLPVAAHMVDHSRLEYWWTPKWLRVMRSEATADILKTEYSPVFQKLAEQGFFNLVDGGYRINPESLVDGNLGGEFTPLLWHGLSLLGPKILLLVARDAIRTLPSRAEYRRMIKETANNFAGVNYFH